MGQNTLFGHVYLHQVHFSKKKKNPWDAPPQPPHADGYPPSAPAPCGAPRRFGYAPPPPPRQWTSQGRRRRGHRGARVVCAPHFWAEQMF